MSEEIILDCISLATHYHVDPEVYLQKPLSKLRRDVKWTDKMMERQEQERELRKDG